MGIVSRDRLNDVAQLGRYNLGSEDTNLGSEDMTLHE